MDFYKYRSPSISINSNIKNTVLGDLFSNSRNYVDLYQDKEYEIVIRNFGYIDPWTNSYSDFILGNNDMVHLEWDSNSATMSTIEFAEALISYGRDRDMNNFLCSIQNLSPNYIHIQEDSDFIPYINEIYINPDYLLPKDFFDSKIYKYNRDDGYIVKELSIEKYGDEIPIIEKMQDGNFVIYTDNFLKFKEEILSKNVIRYK